MLEALQILEDLLDLSNSLKDLYTIYQKAMKDQMDQTKAELMENESSTELKAEYLKLMSSFSYYQGQIEALENMSNYIEKAMYKDATTLN